MGELLPLFLTHFNILKFKAIIHIPPRCSNLVSIQLYKPKVEREEMLGSREEKNNTLYKTKIW